MPESRTDTRTWPSTRSARSRISPALRRVLDGVVEQVLEDLRDARRVAEISTSARRQRRVELVTGGQRGRRDGVERVLERTAHG